MKKRDAFINLASLIIDSFMMHEVHFSHLVEKTWCYNLNIPGNISYGSENMVLT